MIETLIGLSGLALVKYALYHTTKAMRSAYALNEARKLERKIKPLPKKYAVEGTNRHWSDMTEINEILDSINHPSVFNNSLIRRERIRSQRIIKKSSKNKAKT